MNIKGLDIQELKIKRLETDKDFLNYHLNKEKKFIVMVEGYLECVLIPNKRVMTEVRYLNKLQKNYRHEEIEVQKKKFEIVRHYAEKGIIDQYNAAKIKVWQRQILNSQIRISELENKIKEVACSGVNK